jgi:1,4-alpha-glucan branching enzyme
MADFELVGLPQNELAAFLAASHSDPFRILGPHRVGNDLAIRVFRPDAENVDIVTGASPGKTIPAERLDRQGFFQAVLPDMPRDTDYQLQITGWNGTTWRARDPYCYGTIMGEVDLHLFAEGNHLQIYEKFGAHLRTIVGAERAAR